MKPYIYLKSIILVLLLYVSFIINNSISSIIINNALLFSILSSIILAELSVSSYKLFLSNSPGISFYITSLVISFLMGLLLPIILKNFIILLGIYFYINLSLILAQFFSPEDQLVIDALNVYVNEKNWTLNVKKGILFDEYQIHYSIGLGFISQADKRNIFAIIQNNNGSITVNDEVTIDFTIRKNIAKIFTAKENRITPLIQDIDNILRNVLIEK